MDKTICGIDVSKDRLDVAVGPSSERFVFARTGAGLDDLVGRLKVLRPDLIVLAATGGFETVVVAGLAGANLPVAVANPAQIRAFAKAIGQRAKTRQANAGRRTLLDETIAQPATEGCVSQAGIGIAVDLRESPFARRGLNYVGECGRSKNVLIKIGPAYWPLDALSW